MNDSYGTAILDRMLDPITDCLTPAVAERISLLRADEETRTRLEELAAKSEEGELTDDERREYEAYVEALDLIGILQAKARAFLAEHRRA